MKTSGLLGRVACRILIVFLAMVAVIAQSSAQSVEPGTPQAVFATVTTLTSNVNPVDPSEKVTFTATVKSPLGPNPAGLLYIYKDGQLLAAGGVSGAENFIKTDVLGEYAAGLYVAIFQQNANFLASSSDVYTQYVKFNTVTSISSSPNPSVVGAPVTLSASVADTTNSGLKPSGTVYFFADGLKLGTALVDATGVATMTISNLAIGDRKIGAGYDGDAFFAKSSSPTIKHVVSAPKIDTETTLASEANPSETGAPVVFTASVLEKGSTTPVPTGEVQFWHAGSLYKSVALGADGKATVTVPAADVIGLWAAIYPGSGGYTQSASSLLTQFVKFATTTAIAVNPNPVETGKPVTLTASVIDTTSQVQPSGDVTFSIDGVALAPTPLDAGASATTTVPTLPVGDHEIVAAYGGADLLGKSTSAPTKLTVLPASTATTLAGSAVEGNVAYSAPLSVTIAVADVGGTPAAGTVELLEGSPPATVIASGDLAGGTVTLAVPTLAPGEHFLTARFTGSATLAPSDSTARYYNVIAAESATALSLSTDHAAPGDPVVLTATVTPVAPATGVPAGTVTFRRAGAVLGTVPLTAGSALLDVALPYGAYALTASYEPSPEFKGSKSAETALVVDRKVGPETIVNTTTKGVQSAPAVSFGTTGGALVVWEDKAKASDKKAAIRGRVIGIGGVPAGPDFVIAKAAEGVAAPMVSGLLGGDYAVVWQAGKAGDRDVYLQIVTAAGKPKGAAKVIHEGKAGEQVAPVVMPYDDKGEFLVAWQSTHPGTDGSDIFALRFDKTGEVKGKLIEVNGAAKGDQVRPVATPLTTGGFAIGWSGPLKTGHGAFVQYYTKTGKAKGKAFSIDAKPTTASPRLALMIGDAAGIVAGWDEPDKKGSAARNAFGAVFSSAGKRLGPIVQLDTTKKGDQGQPAMMPVVGPVSGPRLATAWTAPDADGAGISLSLFSPTAARDGDIEPANTTTKGAQTAPVLAGILSGIPTTSYFLAVWATTQADAGDVAMQVFQLK